MSVEDVGIVYNPQSRGGRSSKIVSKVETSLQKRGCYPVTVEPESAEAVEGTVRSLANKGIRRVLLLGGDGLLHQALPALVSSSMTVGVIPSGTGNDFARAFSLSGGVEKMVSSAMGEPRLLDVLTYTRDGSDEKYVASVLTGGFSGLVNEQAKRISIKGGYTYTLATLKSLPSLSPVEIKMVTEDETIEKKISFFAVANTKFFGGGMAICPKAVATDGYFDVILVDEVSPFLLTWMLPKIFWGGHVKHPAVSLFRSKKVSIEIDCDLWADGENLGTAGASGSAWQLAVKEQALSFACS